MAINTVAVMPEQGAEISNLQNVEILIAREA